MSDPVVLILSEIMVLLKDHLSLQRTKYRLRISRQSASDR
ncbi:MAG: hypothetical protein ACJA13_003913 [Paraglaciecola sp.]|jgi:hypothetical protein